MHRQITKNEKAISSLALILLLLISAIVGGIISYLWVTGYYVSLKEKIPEESTAVITNLLFDPQNATSFNVTILNPSYSPDEEIQVSGIAIRGGETDTTLERVTVTNPAIRPQPFPLKRGQSQTFICGGNFWTQYVNRTVIVSVIVTKGAGSTKTIKLPYTNLNITNIDFNLSRGIRNFTITLQNDKNSATYLNVTEIKFDGTVLNSTYIPKLPSLAPNTTAVLTANFNWSSYTALGGLHTIAVTTRQGYLQQRGVELPKLALSVQNVTFDPDDMKHFNFTVKNQVSTNAYLNVSKIELTANNTVTNLTTKVAQSLNSSTNGVLSNSTRTFTCEWNWTYNRNKDAVITIHTLQDISAQGAQKTKPAALLSVTAPVFPDTGHIFINVTNSGFPRSIKPANVTKIQIRLENGSLIDVPTSRLIDVGNTTMLNCAFNWEPYLNKTITIFIYTNESAVEPNTSITARTPANASTYHVYLTMPWANFTAADLTHFYVNVTNSASSDRNANVTGIAAMLDDGTGISVMFTPQVVAINSTATFTCDWDWAACRNKNVIIRVYTDEGLRAFYIARTP